MRGSKLMSASQLVNSRYQSLHDSLFRFDDYWHAKHARHPDRLSLLLKQQRPLQQMVVGIIKALSLEPQTNASPSHKK